MGDTTLVNNIGEEATLTYEVSASGSLVSNNYQGNLDFVAVSDNDLLFPMDELLSPIISKESDTVSLLGTQAESNVLEYVNEISPKTIATPTDCLRESNSEDDNARTSTPKQSNKNFGDENLPSVSGINQLTKRHSDDILLTAVSNKTPCKSSQNHNSSHSRFIPNELKLTTPFKNALFFPKVETTSNKRVSKKITPTVAISDDFMAYQKKEEEKKAQEEEKRKLRKEKIQKSKIEKEKKQADLKEAKKGKNTVVVSKPKIRKHKLSKAYQIHRETMSCSESESDSISTPRLNINKPETKNPSLNSGFKSKSRVISNTSSSDIDKLPSCVPETVTYKRATPCYFSI